MLAKQIKKYIFLAVFIYVILYCNSIQFILSFLIGPLLELVIPSFAEIINPDHIVSSVQTGSGDTRFDYYLILFFAILAITLSLVISIIDYRRPNYKSLYKWLLLVLRYYLAYQMINYGLSKIFYLQFSEPSQVQLNQLVGDKSPMGLLWTFMGFSKPYTVFTGIAEFVGGILLLSRKTTLLGALVTFGVMSNVMMLNYCYDVPVKLLSTHMVIFSLIILSFYGKNIFNFFILNKTTSVYSIQDIIPASFARPKFYIKWIVLILFVGFQFYNMNTYKQMRKSRTNSSEALAGIYEVRHFELYRDNELMEDPPPQIIWDEMSISKYGIANIELKESTGYRLLSEADTLNNKLKLKYYEDDTVGVNLDYKLSIGGTLYLNGPFKKDSISAILQNNGEFNLTKQKFRWVQERPDNR